jgi:hypothetical protein
VNATVSRTHRSWTFRRSLGVGIAAVITGGLLMPPIFIAADGTAELTATTVVNPSSADLANIARRASEADTPTPTRPTSSSALTVPTSVTKARSSAQFAPSRTAGELIGLEPVQVVPGGGPADIGWTLPSGLRATVLHARVRSTASTPQHLSFRAGAVTVTDVTLAANETRSVDIAIPEDLTNLQVTTEVPATGIVNSGASGPSADQDSHQHRTDSSTVCPAAPQPVIVEALDMTIEGTWVQPTTLADLIGGSRRTVVLRPALGEEPSDTLAVALLQLAASVERQNSKVLIETSTATVSSPFQTVLEVSLRPDNPTMRLLVRNGLPLVGINGSLADIQSFSALLGGPAWATITGDKLTRTEPFRSDGFVTEVGSRPTIRVDQLSRPPRAVSGYEQARTVVDLPQVAFGGPIDTLSANVSGTIVGATGETTVQLLFDGLVIADSGPLKSRTFSLQADVAVPLNERTPQFTVRASSAPLQDANNGSCGSKQIVSLQLDEGSTFTGRRIDLASAPALVSQPIGRLGLFPQIQMQELSVAVHPFDDETLTAGAELLGLLTRDNRALLKLTVGDHDNADVLIDSADRADQTTAAGIQSDGSEAVLYSPKPGRIRYLGSAAALESSVEQLSENWNDLVEHGYLISERGAESLPGVTELSLPVDPSLSRPIRYGQSAITGSALGASLVGASAVLRLLRRRTK